MADRSGLRLGQYRLIRRLGSGGFAEVYLGEHVHLKTSVAIKVFTAPVTDEDTPDFLREARIVARLDHPHIISVIDCDVEQHIPFLVMKYASGGTLRQRHPKGSRLPATKIVDYVIQVTDALQYAHDKKIIHRDMKPENMLLGHNDTLFLSDFGIALIAQTTQITQDVIGTWAYMAPEQFAGKPSRASDQYSLGIVVYEWLCGERPFQGTSSEIHSQHLYTPPPSLQAKVPGLSNKIEEVIFRTLEKDSQKRFNSVQEFSVALERACSSYVSQRKVPMATRQLAVAPPVSGSPIFAQQQSQEQRQLLSAAPVLVSPQVKSNEARQEEIRTIRYAIGKLSDFLQWFAIVLEVTLVIRFFSRLIGVDPHNLFAGFIYALTDILLFPFVGILRSPTLQGYQALEWSTLIAIAVY